MRAQRIKKRLMQRRRAVLSRYQDELDRAAEELESRETEDVENATELWEVRVLSRLGDAYAEAIARIVAALRRIDEGCYGACVECGIAIEPARLAALPEAATCIDCALDAEEHASARLAS